MLHTILLAFAAFLVGVALSRFLRVQILAPAFIAVLVTAVVMSAYVVHGHLQAYFEFAVLSISLQFGYAFNIVLLVVPSIWQRIRSDQMHAPTTAPPPKPMMRQG